MTFNNKIPKFESFDGKLDRMSFITGIEFLSTFYSTFKFWNEDFEGQVELRKQIWYEMFRDIEGLFFKQLIHSYCRDNIFAPQSPTQLLDYGKKRIIALRPTAEEAYLTVKEIVRKNGEYITDLKKDIEKLDDEITKTAYEQTKTLFFRAWQDTYNEPECRRNFINVYNALLESDVTNDKVIYLLNESKGEALFNRISNNNNNNDKKEVKELT